MVRCCLEHAASVAKTFLMSDVVVVDIKEPETAPAGNPMDNSGSIHSRPNALTSAFSQFISHSIYLSCFFPTRLRVLGSCAWRERE